MEGTPDKKGVPPTVGLSGISDGRAIFPSPGTDSKVTFPSPEDTCSPSEGTSVRCPKGVVSGTYDVRGTETMGVGVYLLSTS